jgi:lambda family phage tail tape measure protein
MSLGSLVVDVSANVARFQGDMGRIAQIAEGNMRQVERAVGGVGSALKMLAGAGAVLAFKSMIESGIEAKARMVDLSYQTGIGVEALASLGKVAKYSNSDLGEVAGAANKLAKALATQTENSAGAAQALKAMGINFAAFKQQSPDQQLLTVAKRMADFADGAGKSAAAMLLFGKEGARLLPFLTELAERGMLVTDQTTESALAAKAYEDNLVTLRDEQDRWKRQTVDQLLPGLVAVSQALIDIRQGGEGVSVIAEAIRTAFEAVTVLGANVAFVFAAVGREIGAIAAQGGALARGDFAGFTAISDAVKADGVRARKELDDLEARIMRGPAGRDAGAGRGFINPPLVAGRPQLNVTAANEAGAQSGERFIQQLQRQVEQQTRGKFEMLALEAAQKGVSGQAAKYIEQLRQIDATQERIKHSVEEAAKAEDQRQKVAGFVGAGNDVARGIIEQTEAMGLNALELQKLNELRKIDIALQTASVGATSETRQELELLAQTMRGKVLAAIDAADQKQKMLNASFEVGATRALDAYAKAAADKAAFAENLISGGFQRMEDALVQFVRTGKLNFSDLFSFMAEEFIRQQIRMALASFTGGGGGFSLSGVLTTLGNFFTPHAQGLDYVPHDGYPALLHEGERVLTKREASSDSQHGNWTYAPTVNVGQGVGMGQVVQAVAEGNRQLVKTWQAQGRL